MEVENPFLTIGYVSPIYFCDREKETAAICDAMRNGRHVTLISQRRMGKTGLIKNVFFELKKTEPKAHFLYIDLFSTQNLNHFIALFADAVLGKLEHSAQKAMLQISKFLKSCRPNFTIDEVTGMPKITLDMAPKEEPKTLQEIFDYLSASEQTCYIAFDEFQQIANYPEQGVEALLRSFIQFAPNLHFVFSGSRQHLMQQLFLSPKRPFFQSTQLLHLNAIDRDRYFQFALHFFQQKNQTLPRALFDTIYNDFEGHTWYIQVILNRLYATSQPVDNQLYTTILETILAENEYIYQTIFAALPKTAANLLKAIAKEHDVKTINANWFITKYRFKAASSITRAANFLRTNEYIIRDEKGYCLTDRFFARWLEKMLF